MPRELLARRQQPVSCESCRKKKLRCDRHDPCHNCQSRAIVCDYHGRKLLRLTPSSQDDEVIALRAENAAIASRLHRLESTLATANPPQQRAQQPHLPKSTSANGNTIRTTTTNTLLLGNGSVANLSREYGHLESVWTAPKALPGVAPISHPQITRLEHLAAKLRTGDVTSITLPSEGEAMLLFERYFEHPESLEHILHAPIVRRQILSIYESIRTSSQSAPSAIDWDQLSLLLVILASAGSLYADRSCLGALFSSAEEAAALSKFWVRCSLDSLEHVWRNHLPSMSSIQSAVLNMFIQCQSEGLTGRSLRLVYSAIFDAKQLAYHTTDATRRRTPIDDRDTIVELEMRRRIWWHLASTDWTLALFASTHFGTYIVSPKHMRCNKPRNINDQDLLTQPADFQRPLSEGTIASYYLTRIELSEICRTVADTLLEIETPAGLETVPYQRIIDLDGRFSQLLESIPDGLRVSLVEPVPPACRTAPNGQTPHDWHRYFLRLTTEARRSKLHLPYLLRASQNKQYHFSRQQCLRSARDVMQLDLARPKYTTGKCETIVLHHFCCAAVILAMDLCINAAAGEWAERCQELQAVLEMLQQRAERSEHAATFLVYLNAFAQRHNIFLGNHSAGSVTQTFMDTHRPHTLTSLQDSGPGLEILNDDLDVEEMWQSYLEFDCDMTAWNTSADMVEQ